MMRWMLLLLLGGCAEQPYWVPAPLPLPYQHIAHVDLPCGRSDWNGCSNFLAQTIDIRKGLSAKTEECVLAHEKKHFDGWTHDRNLTNCEQK